MVIGLFFAIFAVGILYSALGVSQAALFRQHMQDGADSSALSGAVMQARSMNLIVLLNIIMAALLSVLVALKLVEAVAIAGMVIASAVATPTYGGSLALLPPLETIRDKVKTAHDELEDPISQALEALNTVADLVVEVAPGAAEAVAAGTKAPPVEEVYVAVGATLPVEDDEFKRLCDEAAQLPVKLAEKTLPLPKKGVIKTFVTKPLSAAMGSLASTFSKWFCGDESDSDDGSPSQKMEEIVWYPGDEGDSLCGDVPIEEGEELERGAIEALTSKYADDCKEKSEKAYLDGCAAECTVEAPYSNHAELARHSCAPEKGLFNFYKYQIRERSVTYTWNGKFWKRGTPSLDTPTIVEKATRPPCGPRGTVSEDYNLQLHAESDSNVVKPACSNEAPPPARHPSKGKNKIEVEFEEVVHILGCGKKETIPMKVDSEQSEEGEDRSPKRVLSDLSLGSEEFQVRAVASGKANLSSADAAVRLSLWGRDPGDEAFSKLRRFGGLSVAQAEFFYDDADQRAAWMWNMKWRARITRFRATEEQLKPLRASCQEFTEAIASELGAEEVVEQGDCPAFLDRLTELDSLISH